MPLAGVSRPNGVKRLFIVLVLHYCSLFCFTYDTTYFKDGRVNEVPPTTIGGALWILLWCVDYTVGKDLPRGSSTTSEEVTKEYGSGANLKRPAHSRNARDYGTDLGTRSVQGAAL